MTDRRLPASEAGWRRLGPDDAWAFKAHLRRLSEFDRRSRFMGQLDPAGLDRHVERVDWGTDIVLGCFVDEVLRGAGELYPERNDPAAAEAAFSVERGFQDRGLGTELVSRLSILARNRGIRRLFLVCLPENARIRRVAQKQGSSVQVVEDGEARAYVTLDSATPATLAAEAADQVMALGRQLLGLPRELGQGAALSLLASLALARL